MWTNMSYVLRKAVVFSPNGIAVVVHKMQVVVEIVCLLCLYERRINFGVDQNFEAMKPALNRMVLEALTWLLWSFYIVDQGWWEGKNLFIVWNWFFNCCKAVTQAFKGVDMLFHGLIFMFTEVSNLLTKCKFTFLWILSIHILQCFPNSRCCF